MSEIFVSRARGQDPVFASINFPGGRVQAGEFVVYLKERDAMREKVAPPDGMSPRAVDEVLSNYRVQAHLRRLGVPNRIFARAEE
jgi:hypothetical protein